LIDNYFLAKELSENTDTIGIKNSVKIYYYIYLSNIN